MSGFIVSVGTLHLQTEKDFHAFPFGRCDRSSRPSTSNIPVSSMLGLVIVDMERIEVVVESGFKFEPGPSKYSGNTLPVPILTNTVRAWVVGWIESTFVSSPR